MRHFVVQAADTAAVPSSGKSTQAMTTVRKQGNKLQGVADQSDALAVITIHSLLAQPPRLNAG